MSIVIFEDEKVEHFLPLTYTRAIFDLRVGMYTFYQRFEKKLGKVECVVVREYLVDVYRERLDGVRVNDLLGEGEALFLNSRLLLREDKILRLIKEKLSNKSHFSLFVDKDPVVVYAPSKKAQEIGDALVRGDYGAFKRLCKNVGEKLECNGKVFEYLWELISENAKITAEDYAEYKGREWAGEVDSRVVIYGDPSNVYIARDAKVDAYVVIDARKGPVYIGDGARVAPGAFIEGPVYIGRESLVMPSALIREGSNIGNVCRVGGEIEESVIQGYSNKYHAGFIGHAYIGEWVNLGAMTTNSDLKDTYGTVKVVLGDKRVDTGSRKVGCFIGDMVKTSIGTLIYTGKKIGVSSHLHGVVYEDVPSFTIYAKSLGVDLVELYLESAIETQRRMMSRRGKVLSKAEEELIRRLFEITEKERREAGVKKGRFILG